MSAFASAQNASATKYPLSSDQLAAFKKIKTETERKAAPVAIELAGTARKIFANMLADKEDQKLRRKLNKQLHLSAGRLLDIKGQSFREMLAVLTPDQKQIVRAEMEKPGAPVDIGDLIDRIFSISEKK